VSLDLSALFLGIPWFHRLWVVQEVALSNNATLFCGQHAVSFRKLLQAIQVLQKYKYTDSLVEMLPWFSTHLIFLGHFDYGSLGRYEPQLEEKVMLTELMESARYKQATEPHDKVYAMYGLLQARAVPLAPPDYSQPVSTAFCDLTRSIIESSKALEILYQVNGCGRTPNLPSWVPDWSGSSHPGRAPIGNCTRNFSQELFCFEHGGRHLRVKGISIDIIGSRTANHPLRRSAQEELTVPDPFWHDMLQRHGNEFGDTIRSLWNMRVYEEFCVFALQDALSSENQDLVKAFSHTMHCYKRQYGDDGKVVPYDDPKRTRRWSQVITQSPLVSFSDETERGESSRSTHWTTGTVRLVDEEEALRPLRHTKEYQALKALSQDAESIMEHDPIMRFNRYQVLFRTKSGRLGMAPFSIRAMDEIVLVLGLRTPMVVRRQGDYCRLIAPAYVYGIMDGEAWPERPEDTSFEDFIFV
jgi:hypothetical protein